MVGLLENNPMLSRGASVLPKINILRKLPNYFMVYELTENGQDTNWNKTTNIWVWGWHYLDIHLYLHGRMSCTKRTFRNVYIDLNLSFSKTHGTWW